MDEHEEKSNEIEEVAIIAMSARFPGAENVDDYWGNLCSATCSIRQFNEEDLAHIDEELLGHPDYVKAGGSLEDVAQFDAAFFGLSPKEAAATDPQQRLFLEACWNLLEQAGYNPEQVGQRVGIFAGSGPPLYGHRVREQAAEGGLDNLQLLIGNTADHLTTRTSYLLGLGGPSVPLQTACSTSLVAVHMGVQSLIGYECDMCIAGGCSLLFPNKAGYLYVEDSILSPDGYCRPFDAEARGTVRGAGLGVVLLKRLEDAITDRDHIHALVKGSAINNDGADKVGYTAPSVEGQRRVIAEALAMADLCGDQITLVEAHGTATALGDPIEVEALSQAFDSEHLQYCVLGSVKGNIGHCDAAAGIAGLIKAVLCIEHARFVPSLHYQNPNPKIPMAESPFFVNTQTCPWTAAERLAGVSSFGIGGTNAHVILGAGPRREPTEPSGAAMLITLSARSEEALAQRRDQLKTYLNENPSVPLDDIAFTLNMGRKPMPYREAFAAAQRTDFLTQLSTPKTQVPPVEHRREIIFMFPGQGTAYSDLGRDLYLKEPAFHKAVDECCEILTPLLSLNLAEYMFAQDHGPRKQRLKEADLWQPALYVASYAASVLYRSWGIEPTASIGHSIGEYVAATLAESLTLKDALTLVALRGKRTARLPRGAMLAVHLEPEKLTAYLTEQMAIAAVNGPSLSVASGTIQAIEELTTRLQQDGIRCTLLETSHAFHSEQMEPLMEELTDLVTEFSPSQLRMPFISNVTGTWMTAADASDPAYWARHLRNTVRFNQGLETLFSEQGRIYLEVGPGRVLSNLVRHHSGYEAAAAIAISPAIGAWNQISALGLLGELWCSGATLDWDTISAGRKHNRIHMPGYPFKGTTYWLEEKASQRGRDPLEHKLKPTDWFYLPYWQPAPTMSRANLQKNLQEPANWMVFLDGDGPGEALATRLQALGQNVTLLFADDHFEKRETGMYSYRTDAVSDLENALSEVISDGFTPQYVILTCGPGTVSPANHPGSRLLRLASAVISRDLACRFLILTNGMLAVLPGETGRAEIAGLVGTASVVPKEVPDLELILADLSDGASPSLSEMDGVLQSLLQGGNGQWAWRHGMRYEQAFKQLPTPPQPEPWPLAGARTIILLNGLQELGFALAEYLLQHTEATIVLADRYYCPPSMEWDAWVRDEGEDNATSRHIAHLRRLQNPRLSIASLDASKENELKGFLEHHGTHLGVISLSPLVDPLTIHSLAMDRPLRSHDQRLSELVNLERHFLGEFLVLFCDNEGEVGLGYTVQAASHAATAVFARRFKQVPTWCIQWGTRGWEENPGQATKDPIQEQLREKRRRFGMTFGECFACLSQALASPINQVVISTRELEPVLAEVRKYTATYLKEQLHNRDATTLQNRPELSVPFEPPEGETETLIAEQWGYFFGIGEVGRNDDFFELGGHSLLAVQVINKINEIFGMEMSLQQLFETSTSATLAAHIDGQKEGHGEDEMATLLAEIEGLSDQEALAAFESEMEEL